MTKICHHVQNMNVLRSCNYHTHCEGEELENGTARHSLHHFCSVSTSGAQQKSQQFNRLSRET